MLKKAELIYQRYGERSWIAKSSTILMRIIRITCKNSNSFLDNPLYPRKIEEFVSARSFYKAILQSWAARSPKL
jgi:hypothetical protein